MHGMLTPDCDSTRLGHAAALLPASAPVENAICRLNPPVWASTSIISPAKYSPGSSLLSMVAG